MAAKKVTSQTLKEFQAWLDGVEELQAKGWFPDKAQWTKIRKRIASIKEEAPAPAPAPAPTRMPMAPAGPLGNTPSGMPPAVPSTTPFAPPDVEMSPAAKQLLSGGKMPEFVDASSGDVDSMFE